MGTSYSLPRTPEDFLGNVDEMETQETGKHVFIVLNTGDRVLRSTVEKI